LLHTFFEGYGETTPVVLRHKYEAAGRWRVWNGDGSIQRDHHHKACRFQIPPPQFSLILPEAGIDIAHNQTLPGIITNNPLIIHTASASSLVQTRPLPLERKTVSLKLV